MLEKLVEKLDRIVKRYDELNALLEQPEVAMNYARAQEVSKERASVERIVTLYREYRKIEKEVGETKALLEGEGDDELGAMARQELQSLDKRLQDLDRDIHVALVPSDPNDQKSVIVEIRAATGGDEAGLFAGDLYRMYSRYAALRGWQVEVVDSSESGIGSLKEIVFEVRGKGAYSRLKHESGVHRVQRVPETEASGRIHTSTATVAVLPEAEDVDIDINPSDLRIDIFHSGGHGGQNVQKVATAVRIVHLPTGIMAVCQDERSQLKNKTKAMRVLRSRLLDMEQRKQQEEITENRRAQVGSGERSEKIRTYNFPQNRVTDHRLEISVHNLPGFMEGELDPIIDQLISREQAEKLAQVAAAA